MKEVPLSANIIVRNHLADVMTGLMESIGKRQNLRWRTFLLTCWLVLSIASWGQKAPPSIAPDKIFYNGNIITVDSAFHIRQAFAIKGEQFVAVGANSEIRALAGPQTRQFNLRSSTVIPGLMDDHNHQYNGAVVLNRGVNLSDVSSVLELLARVREAARAAAPGETVLGSSGWIESQLAEKRGPTRKELDEVSRGHPLVIFRQRSTMYLNTAALEAMGMISNSREYGDSALQRDPSGELTGVVTGSKAIQAVSANLLPPLTDEDKRNLILQMQQRQNALGLTSIREMSLSPDIVRVYQQLWREGKLTLRVNMCLDVDPAKADEILSHWGISSEFGDHWLRLDCIGEFAVDGVWNTAFLRGPFVGPLSGKFAKPAISGDNLRQMILTMNRYGWRPSPHIFGDAALDLVLDAYETADRQDSIHGKRWVVEHIPIVQSAQMDELVKLGVVVSTQAWPYGQSDLMEQFWGHKRTELAVPLRDLLAHHLIVGMGSDFPAGSNNPFISLYFNTTRNDVHGTTIGGAEKISRAEALRMITINNAYLTFEEKTKGSIEPGKLADFVILSDDLLTIPDEKLRSVHPLATYVGGQRVYASSAKFPAI